MDGKFLKDATIDNLAKMLDDGTKAGILEPIDGMLYKAGIKMIDKYADKFVPDHLDDQINTAVELAMDGDYTTAAESAGIILDSLVDLESVSDEIEKLVFVDGLKFLVRQIQFYIEKKK